MSFHKTGGNMLNAGSVVPIQETTLGQYYERKEKAYKEKLTFEEWWDSNVPIKNNPYSVDSFIYWAYEGWKAAQENM